jgi:hypothetical protein
MQLRGFGRAAAARSQSNAGARPGVTVAGHWVYSHEPEGPFGHHLNLNPGSSIRVRGQPGLIMIWRRAYRMVVLGLGQQSSGSGLTVHRWDVVGR